jgi:hypothetical protein
VCFELVNGRRVRVPTEQAGTARDGDHAGTGCHQEGGVERAEDARRRLAGGLHSLEDLDPRHRSDLADQLAGGAGRAQVVVIDRVGDRRRERRRERRGRKARERQSDDDQPQAGRRRSEDERHHQAGEDDPSSGHSIPDPGRGVAGERRRKREHERPHDDDETGGRDAFAIDAFEQEGRQDEAAHIGEVDEQLVDDREREVAPPE